MNAGHALNGADRDAFDESAEDGELLFSGEHVCHIITVIRLLLMSMFA